MARLVNAFEQFFDSAGDPLISGKLYFYESGSSSAAKDTFADSGETIPNSNPVILGGDGRAPNVFGPGSYRVVLTDSDEVQILARDPVGGASGVTFGADWSSDVVYSRTDVVRDSGTYWISDTNNNIGNQPSLDGGVNWRGWPDGADLSDGSVAWDKLSESAQVSAKSRNLFINGDCDVDQRHNGATTAMVADDGYVCDRLRVSGTNVTGGSGTHKRANTTTSDGAALGVRYAEATISGATSSMQWNERVEDVTAFVRFSNKSVTISAVVDSTVACDVYTSGLAVYGTGGSADVEFQSPVRIAQNVSGVKTIEHTFTVPDLTTGTSYGNDAFIVFGIYVTAPNSSAATEAVPNGTYRIGKRQLELGTQATEFEYVSPAQNLADCKRYTEKLTVFRSTTSNTAFNYVEKRGVPVEITSNGVASINLTGAYLPSGASGTVEIILDAEL